MGGGSFGQCNPFVANNLCDIDENRAERLRSGGLAETNTALNFYQ
jgi:hypothetical protein